MPSLPRSEPGATRTPARRTSGATPPARKLSPEPASDARKNYRIEAETQVLRRRRRLLDRLLQPSSAAGLGRADYQRQCEPILYGWKDGNDHSTGAAPGTRATCGSSTSRSGTTCIRP